MVTLRYKIFGVEILSYFMRLLTHSEECLTVKGKNPLLVFSADVAKGKLSIEEVA